MRNGIYISPLAVRITVGALTLAVGAVFAMQLPEIVRYAKTETM